MKSNYKQLGELVDNFDRRNKSLETSEVLGISIDKEFMPSVANTIGTDLSNYKLIHKNDFACNPMHVGRDERLPVSLYRKDNSAIVSPAYFMFRVKDEKEVLPEYLMLVFKRSDFDRNCWFRTDGSVRGGISWNDLCEIELPVPSITEQQKLVDAYNAIEKRIQIKKKINEKLEETAQAIFRMTFISLDDNDERIPSDWKQIPLENLTVVVTKGTTPTTVGYDFTNEGINFLKGESITDSHYFDFSKFDHIDEETNKALKRSIIKENDILFSMAGTIGKFAIINKSVLPANTNQAVCIIRCDSSKINPLYVYSFLIGNWHIEYYTRRIQEAVQANLSLENIKSLPIIILDDNTKNNYERKIYPIFQEIFSNDKELQYLLQLKQLLVTQISKQ